MDEPEEVSNEGRRQALGVQGSEMKAGQSRPVELLEVEDEDTRVRRFQSVFEKLNSNSASSSKMAADTAVPHLNFDFGSRKTWAVEPPSELLSRVEQFLPQIEASNAALAHRAKADPLSVDIENVAHDADSYIEMNLGLGVFEMKPNSGSKTDEDAEMFNSESSSTSSSLSASSSDDTDSDSDSESGSDLGPEEILSSFLPSHLLPRSNSDTQVSAKARRLISPLPRRSLSAKNPAPPQPKPSIVELDDNSSTMDEGQ